MNTENHTPLDLAAWYYKADVVKLLKNKASKSLSLDGGESNGYVQF